MSEVIELLEAELEAAFEVKDKKSLHRYVVMMVDHFAMKEREEERHRETLQAFDGLRSEMKEEFAQVHGDVRLIADRMEQGFRRMDERFEAVDKRFEAQDKRFESIDKRFEELTARFDARFEANDRRFEDMNSRFEDMNSRFEDMNLRFDDMNRRFDDMGKRFSHLVALVSLFFTLLAGMITAFGVLG